MSTVTHAPDHGHEHGEAHEHHGAPYGITRWLYTTNHKDIGTLYLWFACTMFFVGETMAILIRPDLFNPRLQFFEPVFFKSLTPIRALLIVYAAIIPASRVLAICVV